MNGMCYRAFRIVAGGGGGVDGRRMLVEVKCSL